ncbi:MAG: transcriptional repressor [Chloroflexota bacterium]|nr:transcriptional repressor [Chloroflexota bacterium]
MWHNNTLEVDGRKRVTAQRRLLLDIIREAKEHLDADEIYRRARGRQPSLSLSTVYRNLRLFKEMGLVEEHQFEPGRHHYELKQSTCHHHLVCLGCGRVIEFECPSTEKLKAKIGKEMGFDVTDAEVRLGGYCPECKRRLLDSDIGLESGRSEQGE